MIDKYIDRTLKREGGYVNDPHDRGGETYRGVARKHHPDWMGWTYIDNIKAEDLLATNAQLTAKMDACEPLQKSLRKLYRKQYWSDDYGDALGFQVFDFAVNSGLSRANKYLQITLGVKADGIIGPKTLEALDEVENIYTFILEYNNNRMRYLAKLSQFDRYGKGWTNRVMHNNADAKVDCYGHN